MRSRALHPPNSTGNLRRITMEHFFEALPPEQQTAIAVKCISQACIGAKNSVAASRNNVITACSSVARFNSDRNFFATLAGALWAAAAAAAVGAAVTPWPFNLVLWILAAVLAVSAAIATGFTIDAENKLAGANATLAAAQQAFQDAVAAVIRECDSFCYGDLTVPSCS